jgi:hypothetical protein
VCGGGRVYLVATVGKYVMIVVGRFQIAERNVTQRSSFRVSPAPPSVLSVCGVGGGGRPAPGEAYFSYPICNARGRVISRSRVVGPRCVRCDGGPGLGACVAALGAARAAGVVGPSGGR